jgi:tetratricopeptide (TPR) repeat protein
MAEKIIRDFPLEGYIVQREGNNVLVDLGKRAGVRPGMQFIVYQEGRVIKHPKTGEVLDIERIETGTVEISDVKTKTADARILQEKDPDAIGTGQMVKSMAELGPADRQRSDHIDAAASRPVSYGQESSAELGAVLSGIEELRQLKMNNDAAWKRKYKELDRQLDVLEKRNRRSPDVYLSRARLMEAIDRLEHSEKYIHKALSVQRHYPPAYELRGDIYIWDSLKPRPVYSKSKALKRAIDGYEDAARHAPNKDVQAEIYLKMGNAYNDLGGDRDRARDFWQKAVSAAPSSSAARTANQKLQ